MCLSSSRTNLLVFTHHIHHIFIFNYINLLKNDKNNYILLNNSLNLLINTSSPSHILSLIFSLNLFFELLLDNSFNIIKIVFNLSTKVKKIDVLSISFFSLSYFFNSSFISFSFSSIKFNKSSI